jgi:hypothetical protein
VPFSWVLPSQLRWIHRLHSLQAGRFYSLRHSISLSIHLFNVGILVGAVVASNIIGLIADSVFFLWFAFGTLNLLEGQVIGKAWMTLLAIPIVVGIREWDRRRGLMPHGMDLVPS